MQGRGSLGVSVVSCPPPPLVWVMYIYMHNSKKSFFWVLKRDRVRYHVLRRFALLEQILLSTGYIELAQHAV